MAGPFRRQCRPALGTLVEIAIHEDDLARDPAAAPAVFDAAFARIDEVQRQMSFHDPDSVLSRINRAAPGSRLTLPDLTHALLGIAVRVHAATDGLFDCGVGHRLVRAGLLPDHGAGAGGGGSLASLRLDQDAGLTLLDAVCLDLGGIAKGYAVDQALAALRSLGVERCVVNAGGDLRVAGELAEAVVVRHPAAPGILVPLGRIADGAVATSAPYFSLRGAGALQCCGLFDPAGRSLTVARSYTVIAPDCVVADALTKAVAVAFGRAGGADAAGADDAGRHGFAPFHAGFLDDFKAQAFIL